MVEELTGANRTMAMAASALAGLVLALLLLIALFAGPPADLRIAAADEVTETAQPAADETPHARVHLTVPRSLVPGHTQSVGVALSRGDGTPWPADDPIVVHAALAGGTGDEGGVVLLDGNTWTTTAGELARTPLRVLALGDLACGVPVDELTVRIRISDDADAVETTRALHGPPCDAEAVVAAPESVNLDVPVRYSDEWRAVVERLLDPSAPAPRTQQRRTTAPPRRAAPQPTQTAEPEPTEEPEPSEEPSAEPTPTEEPTAEPSEKPKPAEPKPTPSPTETTEPDPEPTADSGSADGASSDD
jgi:hypothetical protein